MHKFLVINSMDNVTVSRAWALHCFIILAGEGVPLSYMLIVRVASLSYTVAKSSLFVVCELISREHHISLITNFNTSKSPGN